MFNRPPPTGIERTFGEDELIVSKTDPTGRITYANEVFFRISGYTEAEVLGQPHNLVRHPDMPRCAFAYVWQTLESGKEVFAFVKNLAKNGDHYWVFAHITPDWRPDGTLLGYHSSRRSIRPSARDAIEPVYRALLEAERRMGPPRAQVDAGLALLQATLAGRKQSYEQLVFALY